MSYNKIYLKSIQIILISLVFILVFSSSVLAIPAFPGAEGFGAESVGGRGGQVIEVTNLNDAGPGSLRACVAVSGPRICVFKVAGEIVLKGGRLAIKNPYLTIAGQTAPGDGITIRGDSDSNVRPLMQFESGVHNVIVRHIKFRLGFIGETGSDSRDVITFRNGNNIILDHISAQWGTDEVISANPDPAGATIKDITIQRTIIAEGLRPHSTGSLFRSLSRLSLHHNLYAHNAHRNPRIMDGTDQIQVINNVMYNWFSRSGETTSNAIPDFIANYFKAGPWSDANTIMVHEHTPGPSDPTLFPEPSIYVEDNIAIPFQPDPSADNWNLFHYAWIKSGLLPTSWRRFTPHTSPIPVTVQSAQSAYDSVLADVGDNARLDSLGNRVSRVDIIDSNIINDVKEGTGPSTAEENDHQDDYGGYPSINLGIAYADSDKDGMADEWEILIGFDPNDASDGPLDADGDGYTNLEEFLNWGETTPPPPTPIPEPEPEPEPTPEPTPIPIPESEPEPTPGLDTTPPIISNPKPIGTLSAGTTQTTISLTTNEPATCGGSTTPRVREETVTKFTNTGGTTHTMNIPGLVDGESYTLYIKCEDDSGNLNTKDFVLQFSVEEQFGEREGPLPIAIIFGAIIVIIVLILLVVLVLKRRKGNMG